ncbi:hypothetical protein FRUB_08234 [Fimbriiglobus ruber]|uniref:Uncharacterized protein n=1 Tax=Fimbriiglobus ruber TaxID=1908690 RepID=A0A225D266_9BACT|nr:hypothetical protein FRUB_08234 [Fimbriiglobus ruber]
MAAHADVSLCPRADVQVGRAERADLLRPVWDGSRELRRVERPGPPGTPAELVAGGVRSTSG